MFYDNRLFDPATTASNLVSNSDLCLLFVKEIQNSTTKQKHINAYADHSLHSYPEMLPVPPCFVVVAKLLPVFTIIFCKL